jgi:hypothetical protein
MQTATDHSLNRIAEAWRVAHGVQSTLEDRQSMTFYVRLIAVLLVLCTSSSSVCASDLRGLGALLDDVLRAHVKDGYVDYPAISRNVRFHKYIEAIQEVELEEDDDDPETIAFWINVYNALAIQQIIEGQSPISTLGRLKFFRTTEHRVAGRSLDLHSISEDILAEYDDPRIFIALTDAAYSAPALPSEAFRGDILDRQLENSIRQFVNDNRRNRFAKSVGKAKLSALFEKRGKAFGDSREELLAFLARYVNDEELAATLASGRFGVEYLDYQWGINGIPM